MKENFLKKSILAVLFISFAAYNCGSGDLKPGESKELKDENDNTIGVYQQISEKEARVSYDRNQDGVTEKTIAIKDGQVDKIIYYAQDGTTTSKVINYENLQPKNVEVYNEETSTLRGTANVENNEITYVDLPDSNKRITFTPEGEVKEVQTLESE